MKSTALTFIHVPLSIYFMNKIRFSLAVLITVIALNQRIIAQSVNWYQQDRTAETPYNLGTDAVYNKLLKDVKGTPVVVAVIDSGIDIEHEDLADVIWVNTDEIPGNGIDDDNNGYIDDINGWNFIGGKDGSQVAADTYEMTRTYAKYRKKFENVDPAKLSGKEKEQYNDYVKFGKRIESETKSAKEQYAQFEERQQFFAGVIDHIENITKTQEVDKALIDSLSTSFDPTDAVAANIYNYYLAETDEIPSLEQLKFELMDPLQGALDHFGSKFKYNWNPDFDPRGIVGDNFEDKTERYYGNNLVEGPDAMHGTHVAGIIAGSRDNEIGLNGIANNVRIMTVRAVPDGDERDKDVANAIRYAVENGASIINMSFGKGESPYKEVVDDAIRYAEKNDVLIVHASGNASMNIDEGENYPNDYYKKPKGFLFFKKKQPKNYLSIGASGPSKDDDMVASFSNYGKKDVDVFAPGVMMLSSVPDDNYEISQGTSMAAPVISGVAAVLRSYFPSLNAEQVKEAIMTSTVPNDTMVLKPGTEDEYVPFSSLSVSGGIVDLAAAYSVASRMKGKKKISKRKSSNIRA